MATKHLKTMLFVFFFTVSITQISLAKTSLFPDIGQRENCKFNASFNINDPASFTIHPLSDEGQEPDIPYQAGEWINITTEGFEGSWPAGLWTVTGNPTWDDDDFKPRTGSKSIWCARGGTLGRDPAVTYQYVNNMDALAEYGPFDLTGATDAELNFYHWTDCEYNFDAFVWFASLDGIDYYGNGYTGNGNGWLYQSFDLTDVYTIGDVTGDASVWIAFYFYSDGSVTDYGTFVDDVILRKYMDDTPPPPPENEGDGRDSWVDADDYLHIPMTVAPPVIDGELDLEWYSTPVIKLLINTANGDVPSGFEPDDYLDATVEARALWDEDNFYFFGKMIDDQLSTSSPNAWENDGIELYFDGDNSKNPGVNPLSGDDVHWTWVYGELTGNPSEGNEELAWQETDFGFNFELRIPSSDLPVPLESDHEIGFDIQFNDRDNETREHVLKWWSSSDNNWQQPEIWGSAILDPAQVSDILPCYSTDTPPVIDGVADAMWDAFPLFPTNCWIQGAEAFDFEAFDTYFSDDWIDFRIAWDDNNFYGILYKRDEVNANPTADSYQNDSIEMYWDGDNSKGTFYDGVNDTQWRWVSDGSGDNFIDCEAAVITLGAPHTGEDGYLLEFSAPFTALGFAPSGGDLFGFEVQTDDNDDEGIDDNRETMARWWSNDNGSWANPSLFGTGIFIGDGEPPPPPASDFTATLTVTDNCSNTQDLDFGTAPDATDGFDAAYDQYAPPTPPSGAFDARFTGVEDLFADYRATNDGITTWTVDYQAASGCDPIMLNWDNSQFPESGSFTLRDNITGNLVHINMRDQSTYTLAYPAITQLEIIYNLETSVDESIDRESYTFSLANNYPNPFNPTTNIHYSLKSTGMVKLAVYDLMGREVATLVNEVQNAGSQWVTFDAGDLASGVYLCQLEAGGHVFKQKMILLK